MIGNEAYANTVAALTYVWGFDFDEFTGEYLNTPEGFTFLGSGAYRMAFLGPDGVVYKREMGRSAGCNEGEAKLYSEIGDSVEGFRLAACHLFGEVLAMEYVQGDGSDCSASHDRAARYMTEVHAYYDIAGKEGYNWHGVNGVCVLTDYSYDW